MGKASNNYEEEKKTYIMFWWGNLKRGNLEGLSIDGRIILKCVQKKRDGGPVPD